MIQKTFLCKVKDLEQRPLKAVRIGRKTLLISRMGEKFYATDAFCTHEQVPLEEGNLRDTTLTCHEHGAQFDITDGSVKALPATRALRVYTLEMRDDAIFLVENSKE